MKQGIQASDSKERNDMKQRTVISLILLAICAITFIFLFSETADAKNSPDPAAVIEVLSGKRTTANVAWWGFNGIDDTEALQAAINSGAKKVIVPNMGRDWIVRPITLVGNQEVEFEKGTVVSAKQNEFKGRGDCLFLASQQENITLRGYGAILRMRKDDYMTDAYEKAEWRMVLRLISCSNIRILGLTLADSGGDGIYLGANNTKQPYNRDILIRDVTLENNHRQGISVISAENLLIENCRFNNTWGTAPEAGIDLEPNRPEHRLTNCVIRNCTFENNKGAGIMIYLNFMSPRSAQSHPISITFENCRVSSNRGPGIYIGAIKDDGPDGTIIFRKCTVENVRGYGLIVRGKSADRVKVIFDRCVWKQVVRGNSSESPLQFVYRNDTDTKKLGGLEFRRCTVEDDRDRPVISLDNKNTGLGLFDITGTIKVRNNWGKRINLGSDNGKIDLKLE